MNAVRGFPAFPLQRAGARFATTWWGRSWIKALEDTSLDQTLLRKGRAYAKTGQVGPITVSPGRLAALTEGEYDTVVRVERLTAAQWDRFLDQVTAKAGHIAALLDGDMPHELVEAAEDAAVPLLPAVGDLEPECSCPDWGHPCPHAAALCYQASWLLDGDPFVLLLLRGRGREDLMRALQHHTRPAGRPPAAPPDDGHTLHAPRTPETAETAEPSEVAGRDGRGWGGAHGDGAAGHGPEGGVCTAQGFAEGFAAGAAPLPEPPSLDVTFTPLGLEPAPGVDVAALEVLAASAASRARDVLTAAALGAEPPVLSEYQDRVRLAAEHDLDLGLDAPVAAWRHAGADGLDALESAWTPPRHELARAWALLEAAWEGEEPPRAELSRNRWTIGGDRQLRYGRDGRWYPFTRRDGQWWPSGPPERDPAALLT
ncbi:SWIM zinc finger family protein [Nonomuraea sp. 3-1Str]|uniref:SWIM zinc finger family protein n=1 Tax=Nonomuraea sp. 3-1Str TaxID=2929801 RepID=UPI002862AC4A|nr:SWIM zinc finger family protein [Nonomuraea sp. 3-1Str]MDR8411421.1 SWIM zinc finger family protein [Nonomuraea sp. 3-1Str]